jgi:hypothetical protein
MLQLANTDDHLLNQDQTHTLIDTVCVCHALRAAVMVRLHCVDHQSNRVRSHTTRRINREQYTGGAGGRPVTI